LTVLSGQGWRGTLSPLESGWRLELNADDPERQVMAAVGDWLVVDGGLRKMSDEDFSTDYDVEYNEIGS